MFASYFLSVGGVFVGSVFLRELWLVPVAVGLAGKGASFASVLVAGVVGMSLNDVWWFVLARFAPRAVPHMFSKRDEESVKLPVGAHTFVGLLLAVSVVLGARLFVLFRMARRHVSLGKAIFSIMLANILWGALIVSAAWVFGKEFGHLFQVYRPVAVLIFVGLVAVFLLRRLPRRAVKPRISQ